MKRILKCLILLPLLVTGSSFAADFAVIVNRANPISAMSKQELKQVVLGKKSEWPDGSKIFLVTQESATVHGQFVKEILNKNPSQYSNYWKMAIFTGTGTPPKNVASDDDVKRAVAARKDAIGYVAAGAVDSTVKKITIQ